MGTEPARPKECAKVLLVNPNSNTGTTEMMRGLAAAMLTPHSIDVVGLTAAAGPRMIIDPDSLHASAAHVRAAVMEYLEGPDGGDVAAVVVAAIGDPGRAELDAELPMPVVGIGQASIQLAARGRRSFGMATSTPLLVASLATLVAAQGFADQFTGVRLTPSEPLLLAADHERQFQELAGAVAESAGADGAEAVIIAGGPLSTTARRLAAASPAEIVEPVPSACRLLLEILERA